MYRLAPSRFAPRRSVPLRLADAKSARDRLQPANLALRKSAPRSSDVNGPALLSKSDVKSMPE